MEAKNPEVEVDDGVDRPAVVNQWSLVKCTGVKPRHLSLHSGVVLDGCLYLFGGYNGTNRVNDFYKFDFKASKWTQITTHSAAPSGRDRHVVIAYQDKVYIFGGYDGSNRVNDFWQYDTHREEWSVVDAAHGQPPSPRHSHSGVEYEGSLYIFGGYDGNYRNDFHRYNFSQRKWSPVHVRTAAPKARYRTSAAAYQNLMLVVGGHDGAKHLNDFWQLNFDTLEWSLVEVLGNCIPPSPRDSHTAVICGDSMYLFGGSTGNARNDLYSFSFETSQWQEVKPSAPAGQALMEPCPRFCHSCEVYNGSLYVFGGYDGQQRLNDFWQFKLPTVVSIEIPDSSLISDLRGFLNEERLSDVTFVVEGKSIYAHRMLCMRCPYFKTLFVSNHERSITINGVNCRAFQALLEYLYTDRVEVNLETAMDLFVAADRFGVERLKRICEKKILVSLNVETAAAVLQAAHTHTADGLRQSCMEFILQNFDAISKTPAFEEMGRSNVELVFEILKRR